MRIQLREGEEIVYTHEFFRRAGRRGGYAGRCGWRSCDRWQVNPSRTFCQSPKGCAGKMEKIQRTKGKRKIAVTKVLAAVSVGSSFDAHEMAVKEKPVRMA
jgi:hypothetical protein